jgi:L-ascorbate metabolism protein UlaG (beta-lactamase superfamily)
MIEPILKDDALRADMLSVGDGLHLWWLGQSGFLVRCNGRTLLFDPYLSDSLTQKYAMSDKPHVRMTENPISPGKLDFVDVVTSSHNHTDHLDADTLGPLFAANENLQFVIPEANRAFVCERLKIEASLPIGLNDGEKVSVGGWDVFGVPAAHETLETDEVGRHKFMGFVARRDGFALYHSGDTILFEGMVEKLKPFNVDIAFLPINGRAPERRVSGNLNGMEAAQLAKDIGAKCVIPCHYDMFTFNTEPPDLFIAECERIGQAYKILECGERWMAETQPVHLL